MTKKITIEQIDAFIFDFDGVLTNNQVYINENGMESVVCNRSDGLAFDVLRKLNKPAYILSTEKNTVVSARAKKLKVEVLQGVNDKLQTLKQLANKQNYQLQRLYFVGNDLNDYHVMSCCGFSACPADSHIKIKQLAKTCLNSCGGDGVIRELIEEVLQIDILKVLYSNDR